MLADCSVLGPASAPPTTFIAMLIVGVPAKVPASKLVWPRELALSVNGGWVGNGPLTRSFPAQSKCGFPEYAAHTGVGNGTDVVEVMH